MNKKIFVLLAICFILGAGSHFGLCTSEQVVVKKIEILKGPTTSENGTIYIQEDEEYVVRLTLTFPVCPEKTYRIKSHLHGYIQIIEKNMRSRSGEIKFESKHIKETLTIELEGIAPKALIEEKGDETTSADDRIIKGEKKFVFLDVYVDDHLFSMSYEEELNIIISSSEILSAKQKIKEAEEAISEIESCDISDLSITTSLIQRMKKLLGIAQNCLNEGAPVEAYNIADECLKLAKTPVTKDQINTLNYLLEKIEVDMANSSKSVHLALNEVNKFDEEDDLGLCLFHIEKSGEYYDQATNSFIEKINEEIKRYEINPITFVLIIAAFTGIALIAVFVVISVKREKTVYDRGIKEGKKIASKKEISPRDIILGKGEENE